jgi:hypothetical protein
MKFIAKAAIPDAEEAIPELCGNVFCVSSKMIVFQKEGRFRFALRTLDFRFEIFFGFLQKKQIKSILFFFL